MLEAIKRQRGEKLRVPIALDDLRGKRRRLQSQLFANRALDLRVEMRMRADRAAQFPHSHPLGRLRQPLLRAAEFVVHQRQL